MSDLSLECAQQSGHPSTVLNLWFRALMRRGHRDRIHPALHDLVARGGRGQEPDQRLAGFGLGDGRSTKWSEGFFSSPIAVLAPRRASIPNVRGARMFAAFPAQNAVA
jgi:hypothetical protein